MGSVNEMPRLPDEQSLPTPPIEIDPCFLKKLGTPMPLELLHIDMA